MRYFRWGYRYPEFLRLLKGMFQHNNIHCKDFLDEFGDMDGYDLLVVYKTKNNKTEAIKPIYEYHDLKQMHPTVICGLPDGKYSVQGAFDEEGNPFFITVEKGSFDDEEMAIAGAYACWCAQSSFPTGHTTLHLSSEDDHSYYHEGLCGEIYHCHNVVDRVEFDLDSRSVSLKTSMCC